MVCPVQIIVFKKLRSFLAFSGPKLSYNYRIIVHLATLVVQYLREVCTPVLLCRWERKSGVGLVDSGGGMGRFVLPARRTASPAHLMNAPPMFARRWEIAARAAGWQRGATVGDFKLGMEEGKEFDIWNFWIWYNIQKTNYAHDCFWKRPIVC